LINILRSLTKNDHIVKPFHPFFKNIISAWSHPTPPAAASITL